MHQFKENSDLFCRESRDRDVVVVQHGVDGKFYSGSDNINVGTRYDSGECFNLGEGEAMSECLDRGRGINLFENYEMNKLFDNDEDRDIVIDDAMNECPSIEEMGSALEAIEAGIFKYSERVNDNIAVKQECISESNTEGNFQCPYCQSILTSKGNLERRPSVVVAERDFLTCKI